MIQLRKNSVNVTRVNSDGIIISPPPIISTTPATSSGGYEILTRNTTTGQTEKIVSETLPTTGSYTPTISSSTNAITPNAGISQWTRIGNTVNVRVNLGVAGVTIPANISSVTIPLPINRTNTSATAFGSGSMSGAGNNVYPVSAVSFSASAVTFYFTESVSESVGGSINIMYNTSE